MAVRTGIPLIGSSRQARRVIAGVTTLLYPGQVETYSPTFEVQDAPVLIKVFNVLDGTSVYVYTVYGYGIDELEQPLRLNGQPAILNALYNTISLTTSGRYRLRVTGPNAGELTATSEFQLVGADSEIMQPSGVQANRPNLFFDGVTNKNRTQLIEIRDTAWVFNAYGLQPGESITTYVVYGSGSAYREEPYAFNGNTLVMDENKNSVKLNKSGRYLFVLEGDSTHVVLVGNQTLSNGSDIDLDSVGISILGNYATFAELLAAHPAGAPGDAYLVGPDLYVWNGTEWQNVGPIRGPQGAQGIQGIQGIPGQNVELQNNATYIQWRYVGDPAWTNLVALATLKGVDGREVELQSNGTFVQWRYAGDVSWTNLVALAALQGPQGIQGIQGTQGNPGTNGTNGLITSIVGGPLVTVDNTTPAAPIVKVSQLGQFTFGAGDRLNVIATGKKVSVPVGFAGAILSYELVIATNDGLSGSTVVDVWKCSYANYSATRPDVSDTITASALPTISGALKAQDAVLTGWTKTFAAGDVFLTNVVSRSANVTAFTLILKIEKAP